MVSENVLKSGFEEFLTIAVFSEEKRLYRAAVSNYFKALAELCDLILLRTIKKVSSSHTDRFNLLREHKYEVFLIVDDLFKTYTSTYTQYASSNMCKRIKDGIKKVTKIEGFEQEFKTALEKI